MSEHNPCLALIERAEFKYGDDDAILSRLRIGDVVLTTGVIVACDPLCRCEDEPFVRVVPATSYPLVISLVDFANGDRRIAYATLHVSEGTPVQWEKAMRVGQAEDDWRTSYLVDAGVGCCMDIEARRLLLENRKTDPEYDLRIVEKLYHEPNALADELGVNLLNLCLDEAMGLNCFIFETGWGDCVAHSFWGLDAKGRPICLVTDFDIW
jgi:hypothetical protein